MNADKRGLRSKFVVFVIDFICVNPRLSAAN